MAFLGLDQASLGPNQASWAWLRPPLAGLRPGGADRWMDLHIDGQTDRETDEQRKRKFLMCECIGHRPLWGCCPSFSSHATNCAGVMGTADHVMLLRLLRYS